MTNQAAVNVEEWADREGGQVDAFAARLRSARQARGLSQDGLAEAVGLTRDSIQNAEAGGKRLTQLPSVTVVLRFATVLGVAPSDLIPGLATVETALLADARARLSAIGDVLGGDFPSATPTVDSPAVPAHRSGAKLLTKGRPDYLSLEKRFGEQLRQWRKARRWSQEYLADKLGELGFELHQTNVGKIERGERPLRLAEAAALASLFDPAALSRWSVLVGPKENE